MRIRVVCYDLDGTLSNSVQGILQGYAYAFQAMEVRPDFEPSQLIGTPLFEAMKKVSGDDALARKGVAAFRAHYASEGFKATELFEGAMAHLDRQKQAGRSLHIVSAKPLVYSTKVLDHLDISRFFDSVRGIELTDMSADKAAMIAQVMRETNASPAEVVMIGDRRQDMEAARSCGVASIGCLYGNGNREELVASGAEVLVATIEEIDACLW